MGLLPEFFTLLGIEIFAALSLLSALLDRDVPSPARWLFQGAAAGGLGQLVYTEGFSSGGVIDASRFWISVFYLTVSVCSVIGLNIYLVAVPKKFPLASVFAGAITAPAMILSGLFVTSYLTGVDVTLTTGTILLLSVPPLVVGVSAYELTHKKFQPVNKITRPKLSLGSKSASPEIPSPKVETPTSSSTTFEALDLKAILGEWEEAQKKKDQVG